ncbi:MAG: hypothetical protein EXS03_03815 [Phycisphaerales bacterium]|nr:hypothetical protein [Phycisphaerales bacterium]
MKRNGYWIWALAPATVALAVVALVAVPNYSKARQMRVDSKDLARATDQYLVQRDECDRLQAELGRLRAEVLDRGHSLRSDVNESALVTRLTRAIDGTEVLDQSIKIGEREPMLARPAGMKLDRRAVELQMTGSFDAVFAALGSAENEAGLNRVRVVEFRQTGEHVQATVGIDEFFRAQEELHP